MKPNGLRTTPPGERITSRLELQSMLGDHFSEPGVDYALIASLMQSAQTQEQKFALEGVSRAISQVLENALLETLTEMANEAKDAEISEHQ